MTVRLFVDPVKPCICVCFSERSDGTTYSSLLPLVTMIDLRKKLQVWSRSQEP